jgi:hypothetical protein
MSTTLTSLSCRTCGTELPAPVGKRRPATYCSIKCKRRDQRASTERRIPCATCGTEFTTRRPDGKYCSPACRNPDAQRCTEEGCERPVLAKGLCGMDWGRRHGKRAKAMVPCTVCGTETEKVVDTRRRSVCSPECRRFLRFGYWPICAVPDTHPVLSTRIPDGHPVRRLPRLYAPVFQPEPRDCDWCGSTYTAHRLDARFCSRKCKGASSAMRYRARQHNAPGSYTYTEVMHLYLAFGKCCAYCRLPIDGLPEPDHVVPLSRGGSNSISNILPSCSMCNSDKRDLLLHEWALDRQRRHLPPRITTWRRGDPLYTHLAIIQDHERAHSV